MKVFKKNTKLSLGLIAIIVLCSTALLGVVASVTDGFQDFEFRQVNEDNLINVDNYVSTLDGYNQNGIKITVNDDGVIAIKGKADVNLETEFTAIKINSMYLEQGKYTLSCDGVKGLDDDSYYLAIGDDEDYTRLAILDKDNDSVTFEIENDDTYACLFIVIFDDVQIDTTFKPVLVEGKEPGSFYVFSNK